MKLIAAVAAAFLISSLTAAAADSALEDHDCAGNLRDFIISYLDRHRDTLFDRDRTVKVAIAKTALGPKDPEGYVVYINSGGWCGSGGCHTLIISNVAGRFEPLGFVPATELPIAIGRPSGVGVDAELVLSSHHGTDGTAPITLTRQGDSYDGYPPYGKARSHGPLITLISTTSPFLTLY